MNTYIPKKIIRVQLRDKPWINSEVYSIQHYVNLKILCTQGTILYTREINDLIDLIFGV
jgi:hypothetical protein